MRALGLVVAAAFGIQATMPAAQQPSPTAGVVRKGRIPVSNELLKVTLPKPAEVDLPNGLHLIVLEDHRLPQVSFTLFVPGAGGYFDPASQPGLAEFVAALMREGTPTRTSDQVSQQLEQMAATLNIGAGAAGSEATMSGSSLVDQFPQLMDIAADILLRPTFADPEIARYQQRMRAQLQQQRANPGLLAQERFSRAVFGDHPAARISPSVTTLNGLTHDAVAAFHRAHYAPDHAAMAIAGDLTPADARKIVEPRFGEWKKSGAAQPAVTDPPAIAGSRISFVARPASVQTNLVVGTQAISRTDADYDVLSVMNRIIGGGPTGRLFIHLREEKGYTYGAASTLNAAIYRGDWAASTSVRTEVTEPALTDLIAEITALRDVPVSAQELADAKRAMIASFALSLESPAQILNLYVTSWRYHFGRDYWDRYPERISAVTAAQVQAAARKYLAADRLRIVAVGDPARVTTALEKFGEVEAFDADGNKIPR